MAIHRVCARLAVGIAMLFAPLSASATIFGDGVTGLTFLSQTSFATGTAYNGHTIFGLSGIDYDPKSGTFLTQRDNYLYNTGNAGNPVGFALRPAFTPETPGYTLALDGVNTLGGAAGLSSLESVRFDPAGDGIWLTSEAPNSIVHIGADGTRTHMALPEQVAGRTPAGGGNYGLEGMTFTPDGQLWVSRENTMEGDADGIVRLSAIGRDGALQRQFAYRLDQVAAINNGGRPIANPPGPGVGNNGVSEILATSDTGFLVMERGWDGVGGFVRPGGVSHNYVRIYGIDVAGAVDIRNIDKVAADMATMPKTLLFDSTALADTLNTYATKVDNLEGMSFGPMLPDGRRSLVLVSDNNNSRAQGKTQFLVFSIDTAVPEPGSWAMMMMGFGMVGVALRTRRHSVAQRDPA